jgi:hypothetical protein
MRNTTGHRIAVVVLISLAVASVGCTSEYSFVVVNSTSAPVTVEYQFAPLPLNDARAAPIFAMHAPDTKSAQGLFDWEPRWHAFPEGQAVVDRQRGTVRVELEPQQSLRVAHAFDYSGQASWDQQVRIAYMELRGVAGRIELAGDEVRRRFIESDGAFVLDYK